MSENNTDDFSAIEPIATTVTFCGQERQIVPLKVGQLPKFARALKGIGMDGLAAIEQADMAALMDLVADHGEQIIEAVSVATGIGRDEIEGAGIDDLVSLVVVVMRVNADFFARRLMPALSSAMGQAKSGAGPTQSMP